VDLPGVPRGLRRLRQLAVLERKAHALPSGEVEARGGSGASEMKTGRCRKQEPTGPATGGDAPADHLQDRVDQAVFGPRRIGDLDVEYTVGALQLTQQ